MNADKRFSFGPIVRTSLGLVSLLICLILLADMLIGVVPNNGEKRREARQRVTENLAMQFTSLIEVGDNRTLSKTIQQVLARDPDIQSISVRNSTGTVVAQGGAEKSISQEQGEVQQHAESTTDNLRVPVLAGRTLWGEINVRFKPVEVGSWRTWLKQPFVQLLLIVSLGGYALIYLYLRRAMQYLNPSASVPDRVRKAFDTISEGLLILDLRTRVVLANQTFRQLHPAADGDLNGLRIEKLDWLNQKDAQSQVLPAPWMRTLETGESVFRKPLPLTLPNGNVTQLLVSCTGIHDNKGRVRGYLLTFDNVTEMHRTNEELRHTLDQLETSRQLVEQQNGELRRLASRDSLTNCFNRRAFFESAEKLFTHAAQNQKPLCCLMIDIDHFKQFNDQYGHAVGDQVIQVVAKILTASLRPLDVLGRYGGEEFCVVLPQTTSAEAWVIAERMRTDIETSANHGIRGVDVMPIKASVGLARMNTTSETIEALIDRADQALYISKEKGRNRVTIWKGGAAS
jgi:diguanylate cyclase (GGDEF)-like protein/PAS domain S-box-containing protein